MSCNSWVKALGITFPNVFFPIIVYYWAQRYIKMFNITNIFEIFFVGGLFFFLGELVAVVGRLLLIGHVVARRGNFVRGAFRDCGGLFRDRSRRFRLFRRGSRYRVSAAQQHHQAEQQRKRPPHHMVLHGLPPSGAAGWKQNLPGHRVTGTVGTGYPVCPWYGVNKNRGHLYRYYKYR